MSNMLILFLCNEETLSHVNKKRSDEVDERSNTLPIPVLISNSMKGVRHPQLRA